MHLPGSAGSMVREIQLRVGQLGQQRRIPSPGSPPVTATELRSVWHTRARDVPALVHGSTEMSQAQACQSWDHGAQQPWFQIGKLRPGGIPQGPRASSRWFLGSPWGTVPAQLFCLLL